MMREMAQHLIQLYTLHDASRRGEFSGSPRQPLPQLIRFQLMFFVDALRHMDSNVTEKQQLFAQRRHQIHPHHRNLIWVFKTSTSIRAWTPYLPEYVDDMKQRIPYTERSWDASGEYWQFKASHWPVLKALLEHYYDGSLFLVWDETKQPYARVFELEVKNGKSR